MYLNCVANFSCTRRIPLNFHIELPDFRNNISLQEDTQLMSNRQDALDYHSMGRKGKIEVITTKPCATSRDLSLAYSPGVAEPCLEIEKNPDMAYEYTAKGNLVAVVSNGTAVLGLGDIGALAGKPVMERERCPLQKFCRR